MKKREIVAIVAVLVCSAIFAVLIGNYKSFNSRMNRTLDNFVQPRAQNTILLDGIVTDDIDTVRFHLKHAEEFPTSVMEYNRLEISTEEFGVCEFSKVMSSWGMSAERALTSEEEERCFAILERVFKDGDISYSALDQNKDMKKQISAYFMDTYHLDRIAARQLADKVLRVSVE